MAIDVIARIPGATVLIDSLRRLFMLIVVQDYRHQNLNQRKENEQSAR